MNSSDGVVAVVIPVSQTEVFIPDVVINGLEADRDGLVLVVTSSSFLEEGVSGGTFAKGEEASVVVIEFRLLSGPKVEVHDLSAPIEFSVNTTFTPGMECIFWDESLARWSGEGVSVSRRSVPGGNAYCSTTHLTLFTVIGQGFADAMLCAQIRLLTLEAISQLLKGQWYGSPGAILYWYILAACFACMTAAHTMDYRLRLRQTYDSVELFLFPSATSAVGDSQPPPELDHETEAKATCSCGAVKKYCCETGMRDALDEVASEWFEQFSEMRSLVEEIWGGLDFEGSSTRKIIQVSTNLMTSLMIVCASRLTAATLKLRLEAVNYVLKDKALEELLTARHLRYWRSNSEVLTSQGPWWHGNNTEEVWARLHAEVSETVEHHVKQHAWRDLPRMVCQLFAVHSPIGKIWYPDVFTTSKMRALFVMMETIGSLLVVSIFFSTSSLKGRPSFGSRDAICGEVGLQKEMSYKIGRAFAIAAGSVVCAGIPVSILQTFHTRSLRKFQSAADWKKQMRAWVVQDRIIWSLGSSYLLLSGFFIALFLSNIAETDNYSWTRTALMSLLWEVALVPLGIAVLIPVLALTFLSINIALVGRSCSILTVQRRLHNSTNVALPLMFI